MLEEKKSITAYVMINCDLGADESIIEELKHFENVKEIHGVFGAYDIIARVESENQDALKETRTWKIRKLDKVRSTLTLCCIEGQWFRQS
ncbi:MAG: Lrp/AsnC ligand binding domain-containing protein [Thaumarchaeota archaeon]|nr:Lrp/AsnC ligand binding domain-containing protein [Nitrososphaerota archaeon]